MKAFFKEVWRLLKKLGRWTKDHWMLVANIAAILTAYTLMRFANTEAEREALVAICTTLGLTGTALVRSITTPKPPKQ